MPIYSPISNHVVGSNVSIRYWMQQNKFWMYLLTSINIHALTVATSLCRSSSYSLSLKRTLTSALTSSTSLNSNKSNWEVKENYLRKGRHHTKNKSDRKQGLQVRPQLPHIRVSFQALDPEQLFTCCKWDLRKNQEEAFAKRRTEGGKFRRSK